jgi:hypothetical protein
MEKKIPDFPHHEKIACPASADFPHCGKLLDSAVHVSLDIGY